MDGRESCFAQQKDCVTRCVAGETIIVPVRGDVADLESIFTLNEVGTAIWRRLDGHTPLGLIVEEVCGEYDVPPEEAERDARDFLQRLQGMALVTQG